MNAPSPPKIPLAVFLKAIFIAEKPQLQEAYVALAIALSNSIKVIGIAFIVVAVWLKPTPNLRTASYLFAAIVIATIFQERARLNRYVALGLSIIAMRTPSKFSKRAISWYVNMVGGFGNFLAFLPVLAAATITLLLTVFLWHVNPIYIRRLHGFKYFETYLGLLGVTLTFPAITIAINIWKQTSSEQRLIAQAASLRDAYFELADKLETSSGNGTPGTIAMKGLAETLNDGITMPSAFDLARFEQWIQTFVKTPEVKSAKPWMLLGLRSIRAPIQQMALWRGAVSSSVNFAVYSAMVCLGLILAGPDAEHIYGVLAAVVVVAVTLRATVRLITD